MRVFAGTLCGDDLLCPQQPIKRSTLAVWLVRALGYFPSTTETFRFADVDEDRWQASYIERLAELEITAGCLVRPLRYCPDRTVTRAEMATFLVRAQDLKPAEPEGFTDTQDSVHAENIDRLAAARITAGCGTDPLRYCPTNPLTRGQAATMLARAAGHVAISISWLSTGDSYSSETGIADATEPCRRGRDAYGPAAADIVRVGDNGWHVEPETFTACHGYQTEDFLTPRASSRQPSLWDESRQQGGPKRVDILTMSFGGNDIGFGRAIADCVFWPDVDRHILVEIAVVGSGCDWKEEEVKYRIDALLDPPRRECSGTRVDRIDRYDCDFAIGSQRGSIIDFYTYIVENHLTVRGHLYVIGYPQLFAPVDEWPGVKTNCAFVKPSDAEKVIRVARHLDRKLREAVDRANQEVGDRVRYLSTLDIYRAGKHELCGTGDDWLHGTSFTKDISFHPKIEGHRGTAKDLAELVLDDLNG